MIVTTPLGPVAGRETETPHGSVALFLGIPYAEAPGASARFRVAAPARGHREVLDATVPGPVVPQDPDVFRAMLGMPADPWSEAGSLTANVWAPVGAKGLPGHGVGARRWLRGRLELVSAHGRCPARRRRGSGRRRPELPARGLRLPSGLRRARRGIRGCRQSRHPRPDHRSGVGPGERRGLRRRPLPGHRVRRVGRRSGGGHAARDAAHRAVCSAGRSCRAARPSAPEPSDQAAEVSERFLRASGLTPATARELLAWPAERVLDAQRAFTEVVAAESIGIPLPYQPVIDGRSIPRLPLDAVRDGVGSDVDLIVGTNLNEGSFFTTMGEPAALTDKRFTEALDTLARQNLPRRRRSRDDFDATARNSGAELGREPTPTEIRRGVPLGRAVPPAQQSPARGSGRGIRSHVFIPVHLAEPHCSGSGQLSHSGPAVRVPAARPCRERAARRRRSAGRAQRGDERRLVDASPPPVSPDRRGPCTRPRSG